MYIYVYVPGSRVRGNPPPYASPLMGCPSEWNMHAMHAYASYALTCMNIYTCICTHLHKYIRLHVHIYIGMHGVCM